MTNQGLRQQSVRDVTATTLDYNGDWHALFDDEGIATGTFNERLLAYINARLSASYTNVNEAMAAMAADEGVTRFSDIGTFSAGNLTVTTLLLTSSVPTGFTYTGGSATSTYRDSGGELRLGSLNTARFSYTSAGVALGYMSEEACTNLCTNHNATPAVTTNVSVTGTCTVTLVTDATALGTAKIANVVTGNVFQLAGGASGGTAVIGGTIGAIGPASVQLYARDVTSTGASFGITPTPTSLAISGSAYALYQSQNLTSTATTDQMVITVPAGVTINFILNQMEAKRFCTSIVKTAGATATRAVDLLRHADITQIAGFNASQGTIIASYNPYSNSGIDSGTTQVVFIAGSTGAFPTSRYYAQTNQTSRKPTGYAQNSSSNNVTAAQGIIAGRKNPIGITWTAGSSLRTFAGPMVYNDVTMTVTPASFTQFIIGCGASSTASVNGYIDRVTILNKTLPLATIAPYALGTTNLGITERAIMAGGQSNMEGYFSSASTFRNTGEINFDSILNSVWGTSTRNWVINGSTAGSPFTDWQGTGGSITKWKNIATAYLAGGGTIEGLLWDQGESSLGYSVAAFKAAYLEIFEDMQNHIGNTIEANYVPVVIVPLGRYSLANNQATDDNAALLKQAQQELARDYAWIHLAPEKVHQPLVDAIVHLTDTGYGNQAYLVIRKMLDVLGESISGGVDGPQITTVSRSGATVTLTITHDGGTDFTPTSSIGGFRFYDGSTSTEIAVSAAVRTNATTITLTLASTPSNATQILRYAFDQNFAVADTAFVRDNSTYPLPLRSGQWNSTDTGSTWVNVV